MEYLKNKKRRLRRLELNRRRSRTENTPIKYTQEEMVKQAKKSFDTSILNREERYLITESLSILLDLLGKKALVLNGDFNFTGHLKEELTNLVIKLQYDHISEREIN